MTEAVLTKNWGLPNSHTLEVYLETGGYQALRKALGEMTPEQVIDEVKRSNLRGRGGAGFPTGMKWGFVPRDKPGPRYIVVNADESEPGTFKDKYILERDPHLMLEGMAIAAYAIGANVAFIYVRGEYFNYARIVERAIAEAYQRGFLGKNILGSGFSLEVHLIRGAGAYICGEETALLESIEGKKGWPRNRPPFPAIVGLYGGPTVINNVETLACVPHIIARGAEWFASLGYGRSGGTRLFAVSGHVERPGVYEASIGITCRELIALAGGVAGGRKLKAVIPGGSSAPVLAAEEVDVRMDFDSLMAVGSMAGSGGVIVMDETTCMVKALWRIARFYAHESCGQCTPCREGTGWLVKVLNRVLAGRPRPDDADNLNLIAGQMMGTTICALADGAAMPVQSFVRKFRREFDYHIEHRKCDVEAAAEVGAY